jgi:hypothetical protein
MAARLENWTITADEILDYDIAAHLPPPIKILERVPSLRSIFVAVFWGAQGVLLVELITAGCYCGTLNKLEERCLLVETKKCAR